jgi:hypothetical protein
MGVTLHFRGKLKNANLIMELANEVADICDTNGWKYDLFTDDAFYTPDPNETPSEKRKRREREREEAEDEALLATRKLPDIGLRGIMFNPEGKCESVGLTFDKKGVINSIFSALFPEMNFGEKMPWSSTKTQFAGVETHIKLVKLMSYLGNKYFKKFELEDDGGYYPDENLEQLQKRMGVIDNAIGTIEDLLENGNFEGSPDEVMQQIQDALSRSFKDVDIKVMKIDPNELLKNEEEEEEGNNEEN